MRIITKKYKTYTYNELSQEGKKRAVNDYIEFILDVTEYKQMSDNLKKAIDKAEEMQTPGFLGSYIWDYCKDEIELDLEEGNTYLENGEIFII